jgi:hypothetical protein
MKARMSGVIRSRRLWLAFGVPVSALVVLCTVASVSIFPPAVQGSSLGYAVATTQLYIGPPGGLVNTLTTDVPQQFIEQGIALADQMASPHLRDVIAANSGIAASRIAVDGPLDLNTSVFSQEPDGPKRSSQITVQNALYRVTVGEDTALPEISVTAQAPKPSQAVRLANASQAALSTYLTGIETASGTPPIDRLGVSSLGPVLVSDESSGLVNVAVLTFALSLALWSGLVVAITAIVRDVHRLRRGWSPGGVSL